MHVETTENLGEEDLNIYYIIYIYMEMVGLLTPLKVVVWSLKLSLLLIFDVNKNILLVF